MNTERMACSAQGAMTSYPNNPDEVPSGPFNRSYTCNTDDSMAEMGGTPGTDMAAQGPVSNSPDDRDGRQRLRGPHEHLGRHRGLAERTLQNASHRVAGEGA